jgi:hypothetical protein
MTYDPEHYATIPGYTETGDEKGDYRLAWLVDAAGTPQGRGSSMTDEGFEKLVKAADTDISMHGNDSDSYEAVLKADAKASIKRPEAVFAVDAKNPNGVKERSEDLGNGIIALARNRSELEHPGSKTNTDHSVPLAYVVAWVDGRLRIVILDFNRGQMLNGLAVTAPFLKGDYYRFIQTAQPEDLDALRPVPASKS